MTLPDQVGYGRFGVEAAGRTAGRVRRDGGRRGGCRRDVRGGGIGIGDCPLSTLTPSCPRCPKRCPKPEVCVLVGGVVDSRRNSRPGWRTGRGGKPCCRRGRGNPCGLTNSASSLPLPSARKDPARDRHRGRNGGSRPPGIVFSFFTDRDPRLSCLASMPRSTRARVDVLDERARRRLGQRPLPHRPPSTTGRVVLDVLTRGARPATRWPRKDSQERNRCWGFLGRRFSASPWTCAEMFTEHRPYPGVITPRPPPVRLNVSSRGTRRPVVHHRPG